MLTREEFFDAIEELRAFECVTTDDIITKVDLLVEICLYLDKTTNPAGVLLAYIHDRYLPEDGYSLGDVREFIAWTEAELGIYI